MFLAQVAQDVGGPLLTGGVVVSVLGWFMFRGEKKLEELAASIEKMRSAMDRQTRLGLLQLSAHPGFPKSGKQQIGELEKDITDADSGK